MTASLLLLSGGVDSTALAVWQRPSACLFIDYGQRPARGEERAANAVCSALDLELHTVRCDCSPVGDGLLSPTGALDSQSDAPDWWPFRNQLLVTLAAAYAWRLRMSTVRIGTVAEDGKRFADGRALFVERLSALLHCQEGRLTLAAPALTMSSSQLLRAAEVPAAILGWTHSCHVASSACGRCPGCVRRNEVLDSNPL